MKQSLWTREQLIHRLAERLDLRSYPRWQMFLFVGLTGMFAFGFICALYYPSAHSLSDLLRIWRTH